MGIDKTCHEWHVLRSNHAGSCRYECLTNRTLSALPSKFHDLELRVNDEIGLRRHLAYSQTKMFCEGLAIRHQPAFDHAHCQPQLESDTQRVLELRKRYRGARRLFKVAKADHRLKLARLVVSFGVLPEWAATCITDHEAGFVLAELSPQHSEKSRF